MDTPQDYGWYESTRTTNCFHNLNEPNWITSFDSRQLIPDQQYRLRHLFGKTYSGVMVIVLLNSVPFDLVASLPTLQRHEILKMFFFSRFLITSYPSVTKLFLNKNIPWCRADAVTWKSTFCPIHEEVSFSTKIWFACWTLYSLSSISYRVTIMATMNNQYSIGSVTSPTIMKILISRILAIRKAAYHAISSTHRIRKNQFLCPSIFDTRREGKLLFWKSWSQRKAHLHLWKLYSINENCLNLETRQQVADSVLFQKTQTGSQNMQNWLILVHPCRLWMRIDDCLVMWVHITFYLTKNGVGDGSSKYKSWMGTCTSYLCVVDVIWNILRSINAPSTFTQSSDAD